MNKEQIDTLVCKVKSVLTEDLLKDKYRGFSDTNPMYGHCYAASEALYHLLREVGITDCVPVRGRDDRGNVHWWLKQGSGIIDPTAAQYLILGEDPPYASGRAGGFLTRKPSARAKEIIKRVKQLEDEHVVH